MRTTSKSDKCQVTIRWSPEDKAFIAEALELPGCMADGATRQEALKNLDVVIEEWIDTAKELGRSVPKQARFRVHAQVA